MTLHPVHWMPGTASMVPPNFFEGSSPVSLAPSYFVDLPYSPALLLDAGFDASITDPADFRSACDAGFDDYFEMMYCWSETRTDLVFVDRFYTWLEVQGGIVGNVVRTYGPSEQFFRVTPLSWRAGFVLGWLSALALVDRPLALRGLCLLVLLVPSCQKEEAGRFSCDMTMN